MSKLSMIEGIGPSFEVKLKAAGIGSVEKLLLAGADKKGRADLAEKTGISEKLVLKWTNHADLFRIKGIGGQYAELLEVCGVDTVVELANRKAENLAKKMAEVNAEKNLCNRIPPEKSIKNWIAQANKLPRAVHY